jgi:hypothetical protein
MSMKRIGSMFAAAVVLVAVAGLGAQTPPMAQHQMMDHMKMSPEMEAKCKAMMAEHEKMAAERKVADARLDGLVAKMNSASAATKPDAIAVVVTEIVTQRHAMDAGMMKMHQGMMTHIMEHMAEGKDSMAMCPMMKMKGDVKN